MSIKISNRLTPVTPLQFLQGLAQAWVNLFTIPPNPSSLLVLMAQSALETGRWKYIHNYNFGNAKSVAGDGRDFCFFACFEVFSKAVAAAYEANSKPEAPAKITEQHSNGTATVWFYPEHPACRFRAYQVLNGDNTIDEWSSLVLGMTDYLGMLNKRFNKCWQAVLDGQPEEFVRALKAQGYFTAELQPYIDIENALFKEFGHLNVDFTALPLIPDDKKQFFTDFSAQVQQEYLADVSEGEQA